MSQLAHGRPPVAKRTRTHLVLADSKKRYVPSHVAHDAYVLASLHCQIRSREWYGGAGQPRGKNARNATSQSPTLVMLHLCKGGGGDAPSQSKGVPLIERTARPPRRQALLTGSKVPWRRLSSHACRHLPIRSSRCRSNRVRLSRRLPQQSKLTGFVLALGDPCKHQLQHRHRHPKLQRHQHPYWIP